MNVFINPGHAPNGDPDPGAVNANTGLRESDVSWQIGKRVVCYLNAVGYDTQILQSDSLEEICQTANAMPADLFVSIHCNSAGTPSAKGTETWYNDGSAGGVKLAQCIDNQIVNSIHEVDRGPKDAVPHVNGLYVLQNTNMTAVLVETGFISNADDEAILATTAGQDAIARAIARGITDYVAQMG